MAIILTNSAGKVGLEAAVKALKDTGNILDAIEEGIKKVEEEPEIRSVGYGSWPNLLGEIELDAAIMNGDTLEAGAVGALSGFLHPISIARRVMEDLPNVLIVGKGAERFALECGYKKTELLSSKVKIKWQKKIFETLSLGLQNQWPDIPLIPISRKAIDPDLEKGTTCFLIKGEKSQVAMGLSTSGLAWKYPGRLGDSPLIGSGGYADSDYGAAACIGTGEMAIRCCTARSIVLYLKAGLTPEEACYEAYEDLRKLSGGLIEDITLFALSKDEEYHVLCIGDRAVNTYYAVTGDLSKNLTKKAKTVQL